MRAATAGPRTATIVANDVTLAANRTTHATACQRPKSKTSVCMPVTTSVGAASPSTDAHRPRCTVHERNDAAQPNTIAEAT